MKQVLHWLVLLASVLLLGACAANQARVERTRAHVAAVHAAAGAPVGSFSYMAGSLYSWEPLSENELLVYTRPNRAWLLDVGLCPRLTSTFAIGLTSHVGQVSSGLDKVIVQDASHPCYIQKIRPVDVKQLKQAEQRSGGKVVPASDQPASENQ